MLALINARSLSVLYVIISLSVTFFVFPPRSFADGFAWLCRISLYYFVPLACIWYGDEVEEKVGLFIGPTEDRRTPGWILKLGGWILLFLPAIILLIVVSYT
jgi:hypothetical protein